MAYDRIMNFSETFSDHILPDKIHELNVCFMVDGVTENFGGTAGNIAYALRLMGEDPIISATIGRDNHAYFEWLARHSITRDGIVIIDSELTAGAYITTDKTNNQITGFNPGAMKYSSGLNFDSLTADETIVLIAPGNLDDMVNYSRECQKRGIDYIFDPGQALPMLQAEDLQVVIDSAMLLIVNDYEFSLIMDKTSLSKEELLALPKNTIITLGEKGSELYQAGDVVKVPPFTATKVVDPTGAGDAYRGGFISGVLRGKDFRESAFLGSVCASFAVENTGTQEYSFTRDEFNARLGAALNFL